jgi:hypothetical protein
MLEFSRYLRERIETPTWVDAIKKALDMGGDMTSLEIWNFIQNNKIKTNYSSLDPYTSAIRPTLQRHTDNIQDPRSGIPYFTSYGNNPRKFKLLDPKILDSSKEKKIIQINPFKQSICVLGKSGRGKTVTIENILESIPNMEYEFIIPTASTTNLLAQYSPSSNKYVQSRLGKLIMSASNNPDKLYTAVFDECHKSNLIEMINDELLQCISLYRNNGKRFISLDDETGELYNGLEKYRGNLLLPNNFGFIFLSSKPDVIIQNSDFFNRVDVYVLVKQPRQNVTLDNPEYFVPVGDRKTGMKTLEDIDEIRDLNDAD